jgi:DNA repair protein RecO (recombination protein O)
MLQKTKGIIIKTTNYSDSSLIVKVYTSEYGLQSYIARNSRSKTTQKKASLFQPLSIVDLVVMQSNKSNLHRISEINILHPYEHIPYNIIKSSVAMFVNEVLHRSLQETHHDMELYEFIESSLLILDLNEASCANFHLYFMLQLSRYLGFYPQGIYTNSSSIFDLQEGRFAQSEPIHIHYLDAEHSQVLYLLLTTKYDSIQLIHITKNQRKHLLNSLIVFYQLHISSFKEIKSQAILQEVIE